MKADARTNGRSIEQRTWPLRPSPPESRRREAWRCRGVPDHGARDRRARNHLGRRWGAVARPPLHAPGAMKPWERNRGLGHPLHLPGVLRRGGPGAAVGRPFTAEVWQQGRYVGRSLQRIASRPRRAKVRERCDLTGPRAPIPIAGRSARKSGPARGSPVACGTPGVC